MAYVGCSRVTCWESLRYNTVDPAGMSVHECNEEVLMAAPEVHKFYDGVVEKLQKEGHFNH
jgi:hypothetical protein